MNAPEKDVPESVSYREVQEILRTFRDSAWRSITLDLHGMRITVGKDGPPAAVPGVSADTDPGSAAPGPAAPTPGRAAPGGAAPGAAPAGVTPGGATPAGSAPGHGASVSVASGVPGPGDAASGTGPPPVDTAGCVAVRSPAVGAFWTAPSPGQPPFVQVGQAVAQDDQLAIVEVMKLMNPVVAPAAGEVVAVCAQNADLVEYEQVLFWIRPADG